MSILDFFTMVTDDSEISSLQEVLLESLRDLYSAESQLLKALPKMEKAASDTKLKQAIASHLKETEKHVQRLEEIGKLIGKRMTGKTCKAMEGLIKEGDEAMKMHSKNPALVDALIIGAAQRVEHYEMAGYGTARAFAEQLGQSRIGKLLQQTLNEEGAADKKLTQICEASVLPRAFKGVMSRMQNGEKPTKRSASAKKPAGKAPNGRAAKGPVEASRAKKQSRGSEASAQ